MSKGFDKLLRESLDAATAGGSGQCLDAELLAVWFDGDLTQAERAAVEEHAACCARCQTTLAALVRTDPPAPRAVWRALALRWLVPVALAASVILLVSLLRPGRLARPPVQMATAGVEQAPPVLSTPPPNRGNEAARQRLDDFASAPPARMQAPNQQSELLDGPGAKRANAEARASRRGDARAAAPPPAPPSTPAASAAPNAPPESAMAKAAAPSPSAGLAAESAPSAAPATTRQSSITSAADAAERPFARSVNETVMMNAARSGNRGTVIFAPDRSVQWRIAGTGQVERSVDGMSWQPQTINVSAVLTAGAAPSATVCWMVGSRGMVLRTTDSGQTWSQVAFPEQLDLVSVVAGDDKVATVTTATGRQMQTTDGGVSWR